MTAQASETRYARWRRLPARLLLTLLVLVMAYGVALSAARVPPTLAVVANPSESDAALYRSVAARVGAGQGYYPAVVAEQRARGYPLRPFVTVRMPTLAWLTGALGAEGTALLYRALALAAATALALRLRASGLPRTEWASATAVAAFGIALIAGEGLSLWHEAWASMLIALSVACRSQKHWGAGVALGFAAACIRELALPHLCVMALLAWREGSRREAFAWIAAVLLMGALLTAHALTLAGLITNADMVSQGWSDAGGWGFVLMLTQQCTAMAMVSPAAVAVLLPLALLGWSAWTSPTGVRVFLLIAGYLVAFMAVGRADNFYWGLLIAPLLLPGLAFAPRALRDLVRASGRTR